VALLLADTATPKYKASTTMPAAINRRLNIDFLLLSSLFPGRDIATWLPRAAIMRCRKRLLHRLLVFIRETFDGARDFAEATSTRRITHFAHAHTRLDQSAHGCGNCARARVNNFFARMTLRESEAVTDRARISGHLCADKFAHLVYGEPCPAVSVVNNRALLICAKSKRLVSNALKVFVLYMVQNRLSLDWATFGAAHRAARLGLRLRLANYNVT